MVGFLARAKYAFCWREQRKVRLRALQHGLPGEPGYIRSPRPFWSEMTASPETQSTPTPPPPRPARFVPGEEWYALPPILLFVGLALGLWITRTTMLTEAGLRLAVPGQTEFTIESGGLYQLWDEYRTDWEGQRIDVPPILKAFDASELDPGQVPPEVQRQQTEPTFAPGEPIFDRGFVLIQEATTGQRVRQAATLHSRENMEGTVRVTLGAYQLKPGRYEIEVWGDFPPRVFQLRKSLGFRYYTGFITGLATSLLGGLGAPALLLWIYFRRRPVTVDPAAEAEADSEPVSVP